MIHIFNGEIAIDVNKVCLNSANEIQQPYGSTSQYGADLSLRLNNDRWFHICGKNDWGYLLTDALQPLLEYANQVFISINNKMSVYNGKPEVIILGKNEFRAVDILHRLRGVGEPIKIYRGIPVIQTSSNNKIELCGVAEEYKLSF